MKAFLGNFHAEIALAVLVFITHGYFYNGGLDNQGARLGAIFAFVEPGHEETHTFKINRFVYDRLANKRGDTSRGIFTTDWARKDGNYYSNKAPGTFVLSIPIYFILYGIESAVGENPSSLALTFMNQYLLNLWISVFWTSLATAVLLWFLRKRGWKERDALAIAVIYGFGTLSWPFDTQLWGHTTAAAFLILGFCLLASESVGTVALAGFFAGLAPFTEYSAALGFLGIFGFLTWKRVSSRLAAFCSGAALPCLGLLIYQKACFGSFWRTAPSLSNPIYLDPNRVAGAFALVSPSHAWDLLFSLDRGLFPYMPVLVWSVIGAVMLWRAQKNAAGDGRALFWVCIANILGMLLLIASFNGWQGGWSSGPRYLIVSLPFWCLLLPRPSSLSRWARVLFFSLGAVSMMNMLVVSTVDPMAPTGLQNPLYGSFYGKFLSGEMPNLKNALYFGGSNAPLWHSNVFNLGSLFFGLRGLPSLACLLLFVIGWFFVFQPLRPRVKA